MKPTAPLLFLSLMIFYTGCASTNKQKKRPKRPSDATMSFFDDKPKKAQDIIIERFEKDEYDPDPKKKIIKKGFTNRPNWVSENWREPDEMVFISRIEHASYKGKTYHTVSDSLLRVLKVRVAQDIESRIHSEMVSEELINIKRKGKQEEYNQTSLHRDYSTISSNIILDPSFGYQEVWVDGVHSTVYCRYRINRKQTKINLNK